MSEKSYEERAAEIEEKIEQLKAQKKKMLVRQKADDRKRRTHRLISCGAVLDSAFNMEIDPDVLAAYLATQVRRDENGDPVTVAQLQRDYYKRCLDRRDSESH